MPDSVNATNTATAAQYSSIVPYLEQQQQQLSTAAANSSSEQQQQQQITLIYNLKRYDSRTTTPSFKCLSLTAEAPY